MNMGEIPFLLLSLSLYVNNSLQSAWTSMFISILCPCSKWEDCVQSIFDGLSNSLSRYFYFNFQQIKM